MARIFHWFFMWKWIPCQTVTSVLCLLFRPKCKNAYTSKITFLALVPCFQGTPRLKSCMPDSQLYSTHLFLGNNEGINKSRVIIICHFNSIRIYKSASQFNVDTTYENVCSNKCKYLSTSNWITLIWLNHFYFEISILEDIFVYSSWAI